MNSRKLKGFISSYNPRKNTRSVEETSLWKIWSKFEIW